MVLQTTFLYKKDKIIAIPPFLQTLALEGISGQPQDTATLPQKKHFRTPSCGKMGDPQHITTTYNKNAQVEKT